jgi:hypothetical protein
MHQQSSTVITTVVDERLKAPDDNDSFCPGSSSCNPASPLPVMMRTPPPKRSSVYADEDSPFTAKKTKLEEEEGGCRLKDSAVFCCNCGTKTEAAVATHHAAGYVAAENMSMSYNGRCTNCGNSWCTNRMPADFGAGGNLMAWIPRRVEDISPSAQDYLRAAGQKNVDRQYKRQFSNDPAVEMRARYWMCCPNDGTEMVASILQHMPNCKTKIIGQWTCEGCPLNAHGCMMRIGEYLVVSWTGRQ